MRETRDVGIETMFPHLNRDQTGPVYVLLYLALQTHQLVGGRV